MQDSDFWQQGNKPALHIKYSLVRVLSDHCMGKEAPKTQAQKSRLVEETEFRVLEHQGG